MGFLISLPAAGMGPPTADVEPPPGLGLTSWVWRDTEGFLRSGGGVGMDLGRERYGGDSRNGGISSDFARFRAAAHPGTILKIKRSVPCDL